LGILEKGCQIAVQRPLLRFNEGQAWVGLHRSLVLPFGLQLTVATPE
jgi:hypothetical protein